MIALADPVLAGAGAAGAAGAVSPWLAGAQLLSGALSGIGQAAPAGPSISGSGPVTVSVGGLNAPPFPAWAVPRSQASGAPWLGVLASTGAAGETSPGGGALAQIAVLVAAGVLTGLLLARLRRGR